MQTILDFCLLSGQGHLYLKTARGQILILRVQAEVGDSILPTFVVLESYFFWYGRFLGQNEKKFQSIFQNFEN